MDNFTLKVRKNEMNTEWDYTKLADAYLKRPDYSQEAIDRMIEVTGFKGNDYKVADIGAGVAHLTIMLAQKGYTVYAIEPNDAMRNNGIKRTEEFSSVFWYAGTGEETLQPENYFDLVTFGSSFNVTDRPKALKESYRILKPSGFFACMWNHRDLNDSVQEKIESIIKKHISDYDYGSRREDQTKVIEESGLFNNVVKLNGMIIHSVHVEDVVEAWRSHGTLHRQAGRKFNTIINEIEEYIKGLGTQTINIPYISNIWVAESVKK